MRKEARELLLGIAIFFVDMAIFFIPICALLLAYVVIFKPIWFKNFIDEIYRKEETSVEGNTKTK
jgi:hypothetical protein